MAKIKFMAKHKYDKFGNEFEFDVKQDTTFKQIIEAAAEAANRIYKDGFGPALPKLKKLDYEPDQQGSNKKVNLTQERRKEILKEGIKKIKNQNKFQEYIEGKSPLLWKIISTCGDTRCGLGFILETNPKYDDNDPQYLDEDEDEDED